MDRLRELEAHAAVSSTPPPLTSYTWTEISPKKHRAPAAADARQGGAAHLTTFLECADEVRFVLDSIDDTLRELENVRIESKVVLNASARHGNSKTVSALQCRMNTLAKTAKDKLDAMSKETAKLKETQDSISANSAVIRIEENQYTHLVLKLTTAMAEYQRHQSANEAFYKSQTQRQIKIKYTNPDGSAIDDATAAQLAEQVLENNTTSYIFQQSKDVLASIIETRNDIYRIEQSMRDLNQLFNDLAFLVHEQDEILDVILFNMQRSTDFVEAGRKELKTARMYSRSIRNKIVGTAAVATVATAVVGGAAAASVLAL